MNRRDFIIGLAASSTITVMGGLYGCAHAPYTERSQLILLPRSQELALGAETSQEILKKEKQSTDPRYVDPVRRVGRRIAEVSGEDYDWEFHVIDAPDTVNAFALPGGKIFVYTGLFKLAATEPELATVVAHEVGHVIARHGAERMSLGVVAQLGQQVAGTLLGSGSSVAARAAMVAYGVGANVGVILPFSRTQEFEADHLGLILMAKAGYDPEAALGFWTKMAAQDKDAPPEYLSTHPSDGNRIEAIKELLPEAKDYYRPR